MRDHRHIRGTVTLAHLADVLSEYLDDSEPKQTETALSIAARFNIELNRENE